MKPIDVKSDSYAKYNFESNKKDPKFKVADHAGISKYKTIFAKGCNPNWSEEVFVISKIKNTVPFTYVIKDLNSEEIIRCFHEANLKRLIKKFRIEKVIKRKGNNLFVK